LILLNVHAGISNFLFPAAALAIQRSAGHLTLAGCAQLLGAVACGALGSKYLLEGPGTYPSYGKGGTRAAGESRTFHLRAF